MGSRNRNKKPGYAQTQSIPRELIPSEQTINQMANDLREAHKQIDAQRERIETALRVNAYLYEGVEYLATLEGDQKAYANQLIQGDEIGHLKSRAGAILWQVIAERDALQERVDELQSRAAADQRHIEVLKNALGGATPTPEPSVSYTTPAVQAAIDELPTIEPAPSILEDDTPMLIGAPEPAVDQERLLAIAELIAEHGGEVDPHTTWTMLPEEWKVRQVQMGPLLQTLSEQGLIEEILNEDPLQPARYKSTTTSVTVPVIEGDRSHQ